MALDGAFLRHIIAEISQKAIGARVDKIYQPNRDELVLALRTRQEMLKLLISARANSPRVHFITSAPENPSVPPMLCMLLRKRLTGAKLAEISQPDLERMLYLDFDAVNELGDSVRLRLAVEIMGKYSNAILVDQDGKIIDALKRVDAEMSSQRLVLPGLRYELPPPQDKLCMLNSTPEQAVQRIEAGKNEHLAKALLNALQGVSPVVCREIEFLVGRGADVAVREMSSQQRERLLFFLGDLFETVRQKSGQPYIVTLPEGKPLEFSFRNITQYGRAAVVSQCASFSQLLDAFYEQRDRLERMHARSLDLLRLLTNVSDRLSRKINLQQEELKHCADRDTLRVCGDLLNANLYRVEKGASQVELENFYDDMKPLRIKLDPALTASQNAQKYYKDYRKARTAETVLAQQIQQAREDLDYIDTVFDALSRAETERELAEIRQELSEQGFLRTPKGKQKQPPLLGPMRFTTAGGFTVLVGRNNRQNDKLTLKQADNRDIWFHTKNIPGSHGILVTEGRTPAEADLVAAAQLAAWHSKARESSQVPVDYTQVRHVNKPQGAKPGRVIYVDYKTIYATPDRALVEQMRQE